MAITLGFSWLYHAATVPAPIPPVTPISVINFPGNSPSPLLVDATWLQGRMSQTENLVVLDLSSIRRYEAEHIPGAVHGWWQDTMSVNAGVYGRLLRPEGGRMGRTALFQSLGIGPDSTVVAYDDSANRYAARLVWFLRFYGFERAMVLDGGLAAWKGAGYEVSDTSTESPEVAPLQTRARDAWVITTSELHERLDDPSLVIIDARSPAEAADDLNGTIRVGMIPGAVQLPWNETVRDTSGRLGQRDLLAERLHAAGVTLDEEVVIYGRFGVETGQTWLVLSLLGFERVRVYDQGWASWAADHGRPIEPLAVEPTIALDTPRCLGGTLASGCLRLLPLSGEVPRWAGGVFH